MTADSRSIAGLITSKIFKKENKSVTDQFLISSGKKASSSSSNYYPYLHIHVFYYLIFIVIYSVSLHL